MTHGPELRGVGDAGRWGGGAERREIKEGEKNWDNCNSINNKIYLKKYYPQRKKKSCRKKMALNLEKQVRFQ